MDERLQKYRLKVTAGPSYDTRTHQLVPVNADKTLRIENEHSLVNACVRIQDYRGSCSSRMLQFVPEKKEEEEEEEEKGSN